ncbi:hypoxanthine phosphoribosyltransferase/adenylate kinase [Pustulibacterium marinum]|uniref:Hypoxanthine phosphoribosyltransferase n=1 Tax=Pustulibacterium marinum TaxID=1224947 RepID=A0A1I7F5J7_9FLAO|nr:hypoxanthine phosphoribosyltransferase [Pustulibacterium marinum]SFU31471.1 hypoxanthine phosphoribosyltransferase/adenylate kinase [Pustulibacterium marinum]
MIQLHDKKFKPFISAETLDQAVEKMANEIAKDLGGEIPVFVAILNGSFMFAADFVKKYPTNCEITFLKLASYEGTGSTGKVKQLVGLSTALKGRSVVVLEDIVDTGNTIEELQKLFENEGVKELKIATLFFKPEAYKKEIKIDYIGMEIPNKFIVGYGLDYDELGRNLPEVYQLHE